MTAPRIRISSVRVARGPRGEPYYTVRLWQWRCTGCDTVEVAWPRHAQALRRALHHLRTHDPSDARAADRR